MPSTQETREKKMQYQTKASRGKEIGIREKPITWKAGNQQEKKSIKLKSNSLKDQSNW